MPAVPIAPTIAAASPVSLRRAGGLLAVDTHPIQYRAPVFRSLQQDFGIPVTVAYGSDFSLAGSVDREFGTTIRWDNDLTGGYTSVFLARVADGGPKEMERTSARGVGAIMDRLRPGAVLLSGYLPRFHLEAFAAAKVRGLPVLLRSEAGDLHDPARPRSPWKVLVRDVALRVLFRNCRFVLTTGVIARKLCRRLGVPGAKLLSAPHNVDQAAFRCGEADRAEMRPSLRAEWGAGDGDLVVMFSGKFIELKRTDLLIDAVAALPAPLRARTRLVMVGDGEMRAAIAARAAAAGVPVKFAGFVNQRSLSRYHHAADVTVLPSRCETWGLVVNDSLHHGQPVITSDTCGCAPDLVVRGRTGEVFRSGDAGDLSRAIVAVDAMLGGWVSDPVAREAIRRRVSDACRTHAEGYSARAAAAGIAEAWRRCTAKAESGR